MKATLPPVAVGASAAAPQDAGIEVGKWKVFTWGCGKPPHALAEGASRTP